MFWPNNPYLRIVILFCFGILISKVYPIGISILGVLFALTFVSYYSANWLTIFRTKFRILLHILFYLLILLFGGFWQSLYTLRTENKYEELPKHRCLHVIKLTELQNSKNYARFLGQHICYYDKTNGFISTHSPILITFSTKDTLSKQYEVGSTIIAYGNINLIKPPTNPHVFDYKAFLANKGIQGQLAIKLGLHEGVLKGNNSTIKRIIDNVRHYSNAKLRDWIKDPEALAVIGALVLGNKTDISEEVYEDFANTGAIHVLSVSGMHVAIFISFFILLFKLITTEKFCIPFIKMIILILIVWFYVLLTGEQPPVVRSGIMVTLYLIGKQYFNNQSTINILSVAGIIMLLYNPLFLFQISFQFSYISLLSILYFQPKIKNWISTDNVVIGFIWNIINVSISAQLFIFPLTIYYFHKFPIYFALSGLVAGPLVTLIIYASTALLILSYFSTSIIDYFGKYLDSFVQLLLWLVEKIAELPFVLLDGMWINNIELILFFLLFLLIIARIEWGSIRYSYYSCIILFGIIISQSYAMYKSKTQHFLYVYDTYPNPSIDVICGKSVLSLTDKDISRRTENFTFLPTRVKHRINQVYKTYYDSTHYLIWENKSLFIADNKLFNFKPNQQINVDYLLVVKGAYRDPKKILTFVHPKVVILSKNISSTTRSNWQTYSDSNNLVYHDMKTQGAFISDGLILKK